MLAVLCFFAVVVVVVVAAVVAVAAVVVDATAAAPIICQPVSDKKWDFLTNLLGPIRRRDQSIAPIMIVRVDIGRARSWVWN